MAGQAGGQMDAARVLFMATGDIAIPALRWVLGSGVEVVGLVTQPDRPAGRRRELKPPPVKVVATEAGVPVFQPEKIRSAAVLDELEALEVDLIVVMAYGQILPERLIEMPPLACVNLHASLLPKYRGAACIQAAIDAGDAVSGVTLMHVVKALDAGDVILTREEVIRDDETGGSLHDRLAVVAAQLLAEGMPGLLAGTAGRTSQDEIGESSHVPKLDREDGRIDWSWTAGRLERRLRAFDPWPGCYGFFDEGNGDRRLKVFPAKLVAGDGLAAGEVAMREGRVVVGCGEGALELVEVQADGSRRMAAGDWWRGVKGGGVRGLH